MRCNGAIYCSILQMRKLRLKEIKQLARCQSASKWQSWNLNPARVTSSYCLSYFLGLVKPLLIQIQIRSVRHFSGFLSTDSVLWLIHFLFHYKHIPCKLEDYISLLQSAFGVKLQWELKDIYRNAAEEFSYFEDL